MLWETETPGRHRAPADPPISIPDGRELSTALRCVLPFTASSPTPSPALHDVHLEARGGTLTVTGADGWAFCRIPLELPGPGRLEAVLLPKNAAYDLMRELGGRHRNGLPVTMALVRTHSSAGDPVSLELAVWCLGRLLASYVVRPAETYPTLLAICSGVYESGTVA